MVDVKEDSVVTENEPIDWLSKRASIESGCPHQLVHFAPVHPIARERQPNKALTVIVHLSGHAAIERKYADEHISIERVHVGCEHVHVHLTRLWIINHVEELEVAVRPSWVCALGLNHLCKAIAKRPWIGAHVHEPPPTKEDEGRLGVKFTAAIVDNSATEHFPVGACRLVRESSMAMAMMTVKNPSCEVCPVVVTAPPKIARKGTIK